MEKSEKLHLSQDVTRTPKVSFIHFLLAQKTNQKRAPEKNSLRSNSFSG